MEPVSESINAPRRVVISGEGGAAGLRGAPE
jgi:hypothetical protein